VIERSEETDDLRRDAARSNANGHASVENTEGAVERVKFTSNFEPKTGIRKKQDRCSGEKRGHGRGTKQHKKRFVRPVDLVLGVGRVDQTTGARKKGPQCTWHI